VGRYIVVVKLAVAICSSAAIFFLLHPSAGEELRCTTPYLKSGLEECTDGGQHFYDKRKLSTWS
jgi:hypothetical protein